MGAWAMIKWVTTSILPKATCRLKKLQITQKKTSVLYTNSAQGSTGSICGLWAEWLMLHLSKNEDSVIDAQHPCRVKVKPPVWSPDAAKELMVHLSSRGHLMFQPLETARHQFTRPRHSFNAAVYKKLPPAASAVWVSGTAKCFMFFSCPLLYVL